MRLKGKVEKSSFESGCFDGSSTLGCIGPRGWGQDGPAEAFPCWGPCKFSGFRWSSALQRSMTLPNEVDFNFKHGDEIGAAQI